MSQRYVILKIILINIVAMHIPTCKTADQKQNKKNHKHIIRS